MINNFYDKKTYQLNTLNNSLNNLIMNNYTSVNRHKYYLKVHLVFVCKYRKQLLVNNDIDLKIKEIFKFIT